MGDAGSDLSTNILIFPRDFREMVRTSPGQKVEYYVKLGTKRFDISEKTARKRLKEIIDGIEFLFFEDPEDGRIKRVLWKKELEPRNTSGAPRALEYLVLAEIYLHHEQLQDSDYHKRAEVFGYCRKLIHFGIRNLDTLAAQDGRHKFQHERSKLRKFLSQIDSLVEKDPEAQRIKSILLAQAHQL